MILQKAIIELSDLLDRSRIRHPVNNTRYAYSNYNIICSNVILIAGSLTKFDKYIYIPCFINELLFLT